MNVGILGPLEVVMDGQPVDVSGNRLRGLLIRLALDAGRVVTVESLSDALWPAGGPADPRNALHSLVSRLRKQLPGEPVLRSVPSGYCLDLPADAVDALRFERLAHEGRRALRNGEVRIAAEQFREALRLWRGGALTDLADARFAIAARAHLEELRLSTVEDRIEADIAAAADLSPLVAELEALTTEYPLRERLRGLHLQALHDDGRQAEALSAYEEFRKLLADELGADPGPELREIHLALLRGGDDADTPANNRQRGNLPVARTTFVGRAEEQELIRRQFAGGRLVTLVGAGGAGKTRLATVAAAALADSFPGGVWLVELARVTDSSAVPQALISALGLRDRGLIDGTATARGAVERAVEALWGTGALVLLDNCEHVLDAAAGLTDELLNRCPELRVLATSREPLVLAGEAICAVRPLSLPTEGMSATDALDCPSVRLFTDRVTAVRPEFSLSDDNVAAVIEICRRLDGLPLAIELAAARLRTFSVEQLATRLDDRFRLLTGGSRAAVPRHRTLRAVVAWSWDLLSEEHRRLAEWLAMFPAQITPESAGRLSGPSPVVPSAVLDDLSTLVDKSLLQLVAGVEPRYGMLETIREYGLERLAETGALAEARATHTTYLLGLVEAAERLLRGPDQVPWIDRLTAEHENLLAALQCAVSDADADTALRLAATLGQLWAYQGLHAEATDWLRPVLELPGPAPETVRRTVAAWYLVNTVLQGGYVGKAASLADVRSLTAGAGPDDEHPVAALLEPALALIDDDTVTGLATIDRWLSHPDPWTRAMLRLLRAFLQGNHGDLECVRRDLTEAALGFREVGERWGLATTLTWLANAYSALGEHQHAISALEESVRLLHDLDAEDDAVFQRVWLAVARSQQGDLDTARDELLRLISHETATPSARYLVFARLSLGDLARYDRDFEEAARQYDAARLDLRRVAFHAPALQAMLGSATAHLDLAADRLEDAQRHLEEALTLALRSADMPLVSIVGVGTAWLLRYRGDAPAAARVFGAAHALRGAADAGNPDISRLVAQLRAELGDQRYDAAYAEGQGAGREQALALIDTHLRQRAAPGSPPGAGFTDGSR